MGSSAGASSLSPGAAPGLALCAEVPPSPLSSHAPGELAFSWSQGSVELSAFGEAERREGGALRPLIHSLQAELRWVEPPPVVKPAPVAGVKPRRSPLSRLLGRHR